MAYPTIISGATGTQNICSGQVVVDISDKIYLLEPNAAPLYVLVSKLNKRSAINTTFSWLEDELNPSWTTVDCATITAADTTIKVSDAIFNKYDVVKNVDSGEIILVTAVSTTSITAIRNYGDGTYASHADMTSGQNLVIIGSAFEEGSGYDALATVSTKVAQKTNYLQIFRKSVEITKTLANTELYGGDDRQYQRKKKGIELMRDIERAFLFGAPKIDTTAGNLDKDHARRTTGGVDYWISTNATAAGGSLTETEFEGFLRSVMRYGENTKYLFAAPIVLSVISLWAQGKLQMFPKDKTYGIAITQYVSPHGTVNLVKELMLENVGAAGASPTSTDTYGGYAFAIELPELTYRYLQNRDVTFETEIQLPGDDSYKDQYICEIGLEFRHERKHGQLTGVTG
jgi:hypothetical protein